MRAIKYKSQIKFYLFIFFNINININNTENVNVIRNKIYKKNLETSNKKKF